MEENITVKEQGSFSPKEKWAALALYPIAYIYTFIFDTASMVCFGIFALLFVCLAEYVFWNRARSWESWVWLGCLAVITLCVVFDWGRVWDSYISVFFVHGLAVLWVLSRGGTLLEGESGHLLPFDALNGFVRFPFGNFFLRLRCLFFGARGLRHGKEGIKKTPILSVLLALAAAALLLFLATDSLAAADSGFNSAVSDILEFFRPDENIRLGEYLLRFAVSLPIAAWLYGLVVGSSRTQRAVLDGQAEKIKGALAKLHTVPDCVWTICVAAFAAVYLLFFFIQSRYLFGAFTRTLPEGFIVSEYARQGFFELCRVMAINFALLWLVTRTSARSVNESRVQKIMCSLLLIAGILFAVIAISKLALYISCFGFTPKRLQSTWLALVLLFGSATAMFSLWTGKKSFRLWLMFAAVTLTVLHLI